MNRIIFYTSIFYLFCSSSISSIVCAAKCNQACHATNPNKINIHLVPHTHNDVGWLRTVDQYYYGSKKRFGNEGVQYILDSVIAELQKNPARRFVYVETSFFWRWWQERSRVEKANVENLVAEGRLEFLHGGWCMSDEATPIYSAMIDQMTLGLKFLNDTFGECGRPTAVWQIDPFGHSSEVAIEFAQMGFDGLFIGRIDYEDRVVRKRQKTMEMIWRPDSSLGDEGNLFTNVLFDSYSAPPGFCFDIDCSDDPIMDDEKLHGYNVDTKVAQFIRLMDRYSASYKTNHVLVTMGDDFKYSVASAWFTNIDKLIKYVNVRSDKYNLLYSTPSCYLREVNAVHTTWPSKDDDDFFPYGSEQHAYWTGYYTSRATFKRYVSQANNILQAVKQLATRLKNALVDEEFTFKANVAIAQHHDAVAGTEKQHVTDDYSLYLHEGIERGEQILNRAFGEIYRADYPRSNFCNLRNISQCRISERTRSFVITVFNQLPKKISVPITFPVDSKTTHRIYRDDGVLIDQDVVPISTDVISVPGRESNATSDVTFIARNLPASGLVSFYVENVGSMNKRGESSRSNDRNRLSDDYTLDNGLVKLTFNKTDGLIRSVTKNGKTRPLRQNFYSYEPTIGLNSSPNDQASGAYIFRPVETDFPAPVTTTAKITRKYIGENVFEIHQKFTPWLSQVVRLYNGSEDIEFEWLVDSMPIVNFNGIELVTKYTTDVASDDVFYTDSNGRRWIRRIRNHRKYWNLTTAFEPISVNYYPVTTSICIRDGDRQLTVITDRAQGGTSMKSGEIEIMIHRRLLFDDGKGVGEPLDEMAYDRPLAVRGKHTVQMNSLAEASAAHRLKVVESLNQPMVTFASTTFTKEEWFTNYNTNFSLLAYELPPNVHLLTFERWRNNEILVRLEHLFQNDEDPFYARPVSINLKKLFANLYVNDYEELTLAANLEKGNLNRLKWNYEGKRTLADDNKIRVHDDDIELKPMQIRTFLLRVR